MPYLVIKTASNATPESFQLTSTIDKPRIAVNGSYIPLTTNSGGGSYELKINDGNTTYHVMRTSTSSYSQSASASATFNTTADSPDGLESVTNLTRVSTSNTVYQTRASTSATLTRASTSATLTRASTYETLTRASTYETLTRASTYETLTRASTYATNYLTENQLAQNYFWLGVKGTYVDNSYSSGTITGRFSLNQPSYSPSLYGYYPSNGSYTFSRFSWNVYRTSTTFMLYWSRTYNLAYFSCQAIVDGITEVISWDYNDFIARRYYYQVVTTGTQYLTQQSIYGYNTRESIYGYNTRQSVYGYNTRESVSGYATRESISGYGTRVSTSNTVYETRESISGYSGVSTSSSSSSESASGTCWR